MQQFWREPPGKINRKTINSVSNKPLFGEGQWPCINSFKCLNAIFITRGPSVNWVEDISSEKHHTFDVFTLMHWYYGLQYIIYVVLFASVWHLVPELHHRAQEWSVHDVEVYWQVLLYEHEFKFRQGTEYLLHQVFAFHDMMSLTSLYHGNITDKHTFDKVAWRSSSSAWSGHPKIISKGIPWSFPTHGFISPFIGAKEVSPKNLYLSIYSIRQSNLGIKDFDAWSCN